MRHFEVNGKDSGCTDRPRKSDLDTETADVATCQELSSRFAPLEHQYLGVANTSTESEEVTATLYSVRVEN